MRKLVTFLILTAVAALVVLVSRGPAAPAPSDHATRWEYAELIYRGTVPQPQALMGPGGRLGVVVGGPPPAVPQNTVTWITADEEVEAADWKALADKLKAPAKAESGNPTLHRLRVLNRLSADGWEIMEHTGTTNWTFRRRVQ